MTPRESEAARTSTVLAASYLLLFGYVGVYMPWFPPMLEASGFDARAIGLALALVTVPRALLPPAWGLLADRLRSRRRILIVCSALSGLAMLAQAMPMGPPARMAWLFVHGFFLVPLFPLMDAITLTRLGARADQYGRIRLWGSLGFIAASFGFGALARTQGTSLVPWAAGVPMLGLSGLALLLRPGGERPAARADRAPARPAGPIRWRLLLPLIFAAACGQASHGPFYAFFTLQMESRGLAPHWIGSLWAWGVTAEVILMAFSPLVFRKLPLVRALRLALLLAVARWALYALEPPVAVLAAGQTLHAASFALLHIATVRLVDRVSPEGRRMFGQTLLSSCAYGGGIGSGLYLAGLFEERLGYGGLYAAAAVLAAVGIAISLALPRAIGDGAESGEAVGNIGTPHGGSGR